MKNIYRTLVTALRNLQRSRLLRSNYRDPRFASVLPNLEMFGLSKNEDDQIDHFLVPEGFGFFLMEYSRGKSQRIVD